MADRILITAEYVRSRLDYDPETGVFRWRERSITGKWHLGWNVKYAGTIAGTTDAKGHIQIGIDGVSYFAHHLAWLLMTGDWPRSQIDHRNRRGGDNWFDNLREASGVQNAANRTLPKVNTSGFKGVAWQSGKWRARIVAHGKKHSLGMYHSKEAAARAYDAAAIELHGEFAALNFPPEAA